MHELPGSRLRDEHLVLADLERGLVTQFDRRGANLRSGLGGGPGLLHFLLRIAGLLRVGCRSAHRPIAPSTAAQASVPAQTRNAP